MQSVERALTAAFDQFNDYLGCVQMASVAVQEQMTSNLQNYIQCILHLKNAKPSTEAYHLNVEGNITSSGPALSHIVWRIWAKIAEHLGALQRYI